MNYTTTNAWYDDAEAYALVAKGFKATRGIDPKITRKAAREMVEWCLREAVKERGAK